LLLIQENQNIDDTIVINTSAEDQKIATKTLNPQISPRHLVQFRVLLYVAKE